jgi:hypothetical protein
MHPIQALGLASAFGFVSRTPTAADCNLAAGLGQSGDCLACYA